jgi:hypothetical protein
VTPERFLEELRELRQKHSASALAPPEDKRNEFGYGKACGIDEGLRRAEELYEQCLGQQTKEERDGGN